jgi:SAM-dependent methyltransferase
MDVVKLPAKGGSMFDASIVGGGPADLSAVMTLGRDLRESLVPDSGEWRKCRLPGGQAGRILDFGTGTGAAALKLADRYPDAEVVGIYVSAGMVREVKKSKGYIPTAAGRDVQGNHQQS